MDYGRRIGARRPRCREGGYVLTLVGFGWVGRWEPLVGLVWLAGGALLLTCMGERLAVRAARSG